MRAILTYHSIDGSGSPISVGEGSWRRHVACFAAGRPRVVPLAQLVAGGDGDSVALTFDDGFSNFADRVWPLLREHGLPVTLFVVSDHAGGTNAWGGQGARGIPTLPLLDWDALATLAGEGVTLGSHSRTHPDLRRVDGGRLEEELERSAAEIEARTGALPEAFAYPYGRHDARTVRCAARHYRLACTTALRPLGTRDGPHLLPRVDAFYLREGDRMERWGTPWFGRWLAARRAARAIRSLVTGQ